MGIAPHPHRIKFYKQETVGIGKIRPNDWNPNSMDARMFATLIKNIQVEGFIEPVIVTKDGVIVNGEHRWRALQQMGEKIISIIRLDLKSTDPRAKLESLALNRIHGEFIDDKLAVVLADLEHSQMDLALTGFDESTLDKFLHACMLPEPPDEDDIPVVDYRKNVTKLGDLIVLGKHRLLCGSATSMSDMRRLMAGENAQVAFTSPPYNLGKGACLRGHTEYGKSKPSGATQKRGSVYLESADKDNAAWAILMYDATKNMLDVAKYSFINLQFLAGNREKLPQWLAEYGKCLCDIAVWDKGNAQPAMAINVMNSRFEFIFILTKKDASRAIRSGRRFRGTVDNVFTIPPQRNNRTPEMHGATFPVELPRTFIDLFSDANQIILDPFGGTGTTMIACEQLARRCFMMEIEPAYCDVIVKRWEAHTGMKAQRPTPKER